MDYRAVLAKGYDILEEVGVETPDVSVPNFLDFADLIRDIISGWSHSRVQDTPWIFEFVESLRKLRDDFEAIVVADPLILYRPAHPVALEFHQSRALIRYFRCGNGCSKTQSGAFDNYAVLTGQMAYRPVALPPANLFIVGTNFSKYAPAVFEKKYLLGEPGNPLSPVFPDGGAWLHHYDPRKYIITICCRECHDRGRPKDCTHTKSTLQLFSDREGPMVLAGGQYAGGQFDEEIDASFKEEALQRFRGVPTASLMVTGTPLGGKGRWEHQQLTAAFEKGGSDNFVGASNRPLVSLHTIDQFAAGLEPPEAIESRMQLMSKAEAEARVWGKPSAYAESGVFDSFAISDMYDEIRTPARRVRLSVVHNKESLFALPEPELLSRYSKEFMNIVAADHERGDIAIWKEPQEHKQYIIGADVAIGLAGKEHGDMPGDYSCAQVLQLARNGLDIQFEQVAIYHAHINPASYADILYKLSLYYNDAWIVVERRGPGDNTVRRLNADLGCPNVYRDITDPSQVAWSPHSLYGVDTNVKTKGVIVSLLQKVVLDPVTKQRNLIVHDSNTVDELGYFGQEKTESGLSFRFRGIGGSHDDRVMALAMAIYATLTQPSMYDITKELQMQALEMQKHAGLSQEEVKFWQDVHREQDEQESEESWIYY